MGPRIASLLTTGATYIASAYPLGIKYGRSAMATASGALQAQSGRHLHDRSGPWPADVSQHADILLQALVPHRALQWKHNDRCWQVKSSVRRTSLAACGQPMGITGQRNQQHRKHHGTFSRNTWRSRPKMTTLLSAAAKGPTENVWKEVVEPASGKVCFPIRQCPYVYQPLRITALHLCEIELYVGSNCRVSIC